MSDELKALAYGEGLPKRKPGRPKGAAQQNFLTLRYWFTLMQNDMKDMKPYQRAVLATKMMQTLLAHDKHLEKDPNKRDRNKADEMDDDSLLKSLEISPTEPKESL